MDAVQGSEAPEGPQEGTEALGGRREVKRAPMAQSTSRLLESCRTTGFGVEEELA